MAEVPILIKVTRAQKKYIEKQVATGMYKDDEEFIRSLITKHIREQKA